MKRQPSASTLDVGTIPTSARRPGLPSVLSAGVAAAVIGLAASQCPSSSARGGQEPASEGTATRRAAGLAEIRRALKDADLRLVALAAAVVDDPADPRKLDDPVGRLRIELIQAEGGSDDTTRRRELAEMELKGFVEAEFPQAVTQLESELKVAQAEAVRAAELVKNANNGVEKVSAELAQRKSAFSVEQVEQKKLALHKYTRDYRTKTLESGLKKAQADERKAREQLDLAKKHVAWAEKAAAAGQRSTEVQARILALVDRALPVEEKLQAGLARLQKDPKLGEAEARELHVWADDLAALIDEAEAVKAAADLEQLKPQLRKAARR